MLRLIVILCTFFCFEATASEKLYKGFNRTKLVLTNSVKRENRVKTTKAVVCCAVGATCLAASLTGSYICYDIFRDAQREVLVESVFNLDEPLSKRRIPGWIDRKNMILGTAFTTSLISLILSIFAFKKSFKLIKETQKN